MSLAQHGKSWRNTGVLRQSQAHPKIQRQTRTPRRQSRVPGHRPRMVFKVRTGVPVQRYISTRDHFIGLKRAAGDTALDENNLREDESCRYFLAC